MRRGTLAGLLLLAVACGGGDNPTVATAAATSSTSRPATTAGPTTPQGAASVSKPEVVIPDGPPPTALQLDDVTVGAGPEAVAGKTLKVHYVGVSYSTKKQFDASWDRGSPFSFQLGAGRVIKGWDEGMQGMKVGGRRRLTIPPDKGYGARGAPPDIAPNETLVFVVDLLEVS